MKSIIDIVPEDWNTKRLKDLSTTYSGGTPLRSNEYFYSGDINWVKSSELKDKYLYETEEHINEDAIKKSSARYIDPNVILFAMYGATAGDLCILKTKSTSNQAVLAIPLNKEKIDLEYLYYYLKYKTEKLKYITQGGGQPNLSKGIVDKVPISHPKNPAEQTAIATILSKVDEAIAATQNSIKAAEKLKKALMQNLLTGKLKPDGSWRTEDEFFEDEKFGKVPMGWEVKRLKEVCVNGGQYGANASAIDFEEGKPRYIRITDIDDFGNLINENKAGIEEDKVKDYLLKNNDFLFARTGDTVGKSLLYKEEMGLSAYAGYLIKFTFKEELILPEYFNLIAKSDIFEAFKVAMQRVGAKPNINSREYGSFRFPLSNDINEQKSIYEQAKPINKSISDKQSKIQTLQRLKKSLMQNLLTGKVRLPKEFIATFEKSIEE